MGFIERLKREQEEQERLRAGEARAIDEANRLARDRAVQERERELEEASERAKKEEQEKERIRELAEKSRGYLEKSSFPLLCHELTELGKGKSSEWRVDKLGNIGFRFELEDRKGRWVEWGGSRRRIVHFIHIQAQPNGDITVEGGWFGSTKLPLEEWHDNAFVQDKALERAYHHPKKGVEVAVIKEAYYPSGHHDMSDRPGG